MITDKIVLLLVENEGGKIMENNNYLNVSTDPVSYMFFKKEFLPHLIGYHKLSYQYDNSPELSQIFASSPYQNGALLLHDGEISITFNELINDCIVFNDYSIDLITLKMFLEMEYLEVRQVSSVDHFNTVVASLSEEK